MQWRGARVVEFDEVFTVGGEVLRTELVDGPENDGFPLFGVEVHRFAEPLQLILLLGQ